VRRLRGARAPARGGRAGHDRRRQRRPGRLSPGEARRAGDGIGAPRQDGSLSTNEGLHPLSLHGTDRQMKALADLPASPTECEALYREHGARVLRLTRLLLDDRQEAQDVAQEVFLKLVRAYPGADRSMRWGPWLTKVTVNACRDRRRSGWWRWWRA